MIGRLLRSAKSAKPQQVEVAQVLTMEQIRGDIETEALRGSGSWDMAYEGGQTMQPLPEPATPRRKIEFDAPSSQPCARVAIHPVRVLKGSGLKMFEGLVDKFEAEAPLLTLHTQVSMDAFLHVDRRADAAARAEAHAAFAHERVDFLVLDDAGLPVAAIECRDPQDNDAAAMAREAAKVKALDEAGVALLIVQEGTPVSDIWADLYDLLDLEDDDAPMAHAAE